MDRERAKEMLPIIQAFSEGKVIQHKLRPECLWEDSIISERNDLAFEMPPECYRIRPEPEVIYVNRYDSLGEGCYCIHESAESAIETAGQNATYVAKTFIEVLDD